MKPVMLIVLDGWGIGHNPEADATEKSNIPFYKSIIKEYPHTALACSGEAVGLPEGQMGNSEVGHLNLGAGRIVYQDYAKINKAIRDGAFQKNPALIDAMNAAVTNNSAVHFLGLVSDGGVHSHIRHLYALIDMAVVQGVKKTFIHAFMDGRDTPPASGINYIKELEAYIKDKPSVKIATVTGRYWAMDRDKRWDRVEQAYKALVLGEGKKASSAEEAVEQSYKLHENDEFIKPSVICNDSGPVGNIRDGDSVIFFNFRADRARELTRALTDKEFTSFERGNPPALSSYVTMTLYDETFSFPAAFPPMQLNNIFAEVLSGHNLKQLRIAETEKYAHVTYFFNGGEERSFDGEDRSLIPSPRDVATYDLKPEMSAYLVTDEVVKRIQQQSYDFILLNFANPDMVGHTGIMEAAVKACEAIDKCLKRISEEIDKAGGLLLITADHGNCELMFENNGPFTAHTTNLVPFILLKKGIKLRDKGILADVAPTLLELMGIKQPEEMTGKSLIEK
ncbi:MAG: 2,3-bisphosphoglycerate-independent phosphoglycerate mutase [Nitrospirae bacterium]|nr:2,3-bisphosphoglycerate-independent phosphoglycerate mutase [Nitrospirota bacterium]